MLGSAAGLSISTLIVCFSASEAHYELGVSIPELKLNMWFLDAGHLVGKAAGLVRCLEIIKRVGEPLGLFLNLPKCMIYGVNLTTLC
jgi:hypothetical protein